MSVEVCCRTQQSPGFPRKSSGESLTEGREAHSQSGSVEWGGILKSDGIGSFRRRNRPGAIRPRVGHPAPIEGHERIHRARQLGPAEPGPASVGAESDTPCASLPPDTRCVLCNEPSPRGAETNSAIGRRPASRFARRVGAGQGARTARTRTGRPRRITRETTLQGGPKFPRLPRTAITRGEGGRRAVGREVRVAAQCGAGARGVGQGREGRDPPLERSRAGELRCGPQPLRRPRTNIRAKPPARMAGGFVLANRPIAPRLAGPDLLTSAARDDPPSVARLACSRPRPLRAAGCDAQNRCPKTANGSSVALESINFSLDF
jgi:hypothetical protein